jgi:hypothetical protein
MEERVRAWVPVPVGEPVVVSDSDVTPCVEGVAVRSLSPQERKDLCMHTYNAMVNSINSYTVRTKGWTNALQREKPTKRVRTAKAAGGSKRVKGV